MYAKVVELSIEAACLHSTAPVVGFDIAPAKKIAALGPQ